MEQQLKKQKEIWCGIDVSKDTMVAALDLDWELPVRKLPCINQQRTLDGLKDLVDWCTGHGVAQEKLHFFMESTGPYSRELEMWMHIHFPGIPVSVGNPRMVKHFIESEHLGNKTDALDARAIARMGTIQKMAATPLPAPEYLQLQELVRARDTLKCKMRSLEVTRDAMLDKTSQAAVAFTCVIKVMGAELKKIEQALYDLVARIPEIRETVKRMQTMPGIGLIAACTILSELGKFSEMHTRNQFSGYTGLQPVQRESGTSVNSSHLSKNGSPLLRKVLFMCSNHSIRMIPSLSAMYTRMTMKGKKPMTAKCACMRKMLLILRSMVLDGHDFQENYVCHQNPI